MAIRSALGTGRKGILQSIVVDGMRSGLYGTLAGLGLAVVVGRLV